MKSVLFIAIMGKNKIMKNLFDKMKKEGVKADLKNGDRLEVILYKGANLGMGKKK